jgi:hypothetical protein
LLLQRIICDSRAIESEAYSKKVKQKIILYSLLNYLGVGLIGATVSAILWPPGDLSFGAFVGSLLAFCFGIRGGWRSASADVQPIQTVTWSWGKAGTGLLIVSLLVIFGILLQLLNTIRFLPNISYSMFPAFLVASGRPLLLLVAIVGIIGSFLFGFHWRPVAGSFTPNIGIRRSLVCSLLGAILCVFMYPFQVAAFRLWAPEAILVSNSFYVWVGLAYIVGLCTGGLEVIRHLVLRFLLVCTGNVPVNYVRFLEYATRLIFLRRAGGSYIFIHPTFMEHFAKRSNE